jgi:hypothetical protein
MPCPVRRPHTVGYFPVPERPIFCGLFSASSVITRVPLTGPFAVFIHGEVGSPPNPEAVREFADSLMKDGIRHLLVFANMHCDPAYFGTFFAGTRGSGLQCVPLFLGEVAYSLLTTTIVYLEFRDAVSWELLTYL